LYFSNRHLTIEDQSEISGIDGKEWNVNIKDIVKDKQGRFSFYRDKQLFYRTEDDFEFPVPIDDVANATFLAEDKAILFMRWIRKHIDTIEKARIEQETLSGNLAVRMEADKRLPLLSCVKMPMESGG